MEGLCHNLATTHLSVARSSAPFCRSKSEVITLMSLKRHQCESRHMKYPPATLCFPWLPSVCASAPARLLWVQGHRDCPGKLKSLSVRGRAGGHWNFPCFRLAVQCLRGARRNLSSESLLQVNTKKPSVTEIGSSEVNETSLL